MSNSHAVLLWRIMRSTTLIMEMIKIMKRITFSWEDDENYDNDISSDANKQWIAGLFENVIRTCIMQYRLLSNPYITTIFVRFVVACIT